MDNVLINLFTNKCPAGTKNSPVQEKTSDQDSTSDTFSFLDILSNKVSINTILTGTGQKNNSSSHQEDAEVPDSMLTVTQEDGDGPAVSIIQEDPGMVYATSSSCTQGIVELLQAYLRKSVPDIPQNDLSDEIADSFSADTITDPDFGKVDGLSGSADVQKSDVINTATNNGAGSAIKNFLTNLLSFLEEGESVQFTIKVPEISDQLLTETFSDLTKNMSIAISSDTQETVSGSTAKAVLPDADEEAIDTSKQAIQTNGGENTSIIDYLVSVLNQAGQPAATISSEPVSDKEGNSSENSGNEMAQTDSAVTNKYNKMDMTDGLKTKNGNNTYKNIADLRSVSFPNSTGMDKEQVILPTASQNNSKAMEQNAVVPVNKEVYKTIEVMKTGNGNSAFEIVFSEPAAVRNDNPNNDSVPIVRTEMITASIDEGTTEEDSEVSAELADDSQGKSENKLLSQHDVVKTADLSGKETAKGTEKASFSTAMTDRIEKIAEQYAGKSNSMDMVVRLRIDDKDTLLVGLKDLDGSVAVEVKTTSDSMGNFLQIQKEDIAKQLEARNIHANIYVDVQNDGSQKREQKEREKADHEEHDSDGFDSFMEKVV